MMNRDALHQAQLWQESRGRPDALSPAGAMGLMQIMPATARNPGFGLQPLNDPWNPQANEQFGRAYMDKMLQRYGGDQTRALVAYNWGAGNADKWDGRAESLPAETRNYVNQILGDAGRSVQVASAGEFDPVAAGAVPVEDEFDPVKAGAVPVEEAAALEQEPGASFGQKVGAVVDSVGQALTFNTSDEIEAGLSTGFGFLGDYDKQLEAVRSRMRENEQAAPGYYLAGSLGGAVAGGAGLVKAGASLLPRLANAGLKARIAGGAAEGAAYGAAYGAGGAEGGLRERAEGAALGAGVGGAAGGAIPVVGTVARGVGGAVYNAVAPRVQAIANPAGEASRRVGEALLRDGRMGQQVVSNADEASAALNNQQLMNFDRGGETVRALSRSVANQSPESRGVMERVISDRFEGQAARARDVLTRVAGGQVDDVAFQDALRQASKRANRPAYRKAYADGSSIEVTQEMRRLMSAPEVVNAMQSVAKGGGQTRAVAEGYGTFRTGIEVSESGSIKFLPRAKDNSRAYSDLQFWDYVKQELDGMANVAARSGDKGRASAIRDITRSLRNELDTQVPSYAEARQGAAKFFQAEDALEAGRKFVTQSKDLRFAAKAMSRMNPVERETFKTGFAAELSEKLGQVSDRRNVINQIFGSPNARKKVELVFGRQGAQEIQQFVKLEAAMDMMRSAMGGSSTARQIFEMGLGAGGGYLTTGDFAGIMTGAALARGTGYIANKAEERVMREVAKILISGDRKLLAPAAKKALKSIQMQKGIDRMMDLLEGAARTAGAEQGTREPLTIDVRKTIPQTN